MLPDVPSTKESILVAGRFSRNQTVKYRYALKEVTTEWFCVLRIKKKMSGNEGSREKLNECNYNKSLS